MTSIQPPSVWLAWPYSSVLQKFVSPSLGEAIRYIVDQGRLRIITKSVLQIFIFLQVLIDIECIGRAMLILTRTDEMFQSGNCVWTKRRDQVRVGSNVPETIHLGKLQLTKYEVQRLMRETPNTQPH